MFTFPIVLPALEVQQEIGKFYVVVMPASLLLDVAFSDHLRAEANSGGGYSLLGTQRGLLHDRLRTIADYIDRGDSAFPNSVILAGNYRSDDGLIEERDNLKWSIRATPCGFELVIPSADRLAAIIDGQHRIFAFKYANPERLSTGMICSVFLDLPKPFQAQLFATINSTQRPVDKSLTYELFGYNIGEEPERFWSPDKLAVFLTRKLNTEKDSAVRGRVEIAPENDMALETGSDGTWHVSMATMVEGIVRLISSNPKRDLNDLLTPSPKERSALRSAVRADRSPLRDIYLSGNDQLLYSLVKNYLAAVDQVFWKPAPPRSFITKTVGIQALFDILRKTALSFITQKDVSEVSMSRWLAAAGTIDFSMDNFRNASGAGRTDIRRALEAKLGIE